jgi:hypothetical protein
MHGALANRVPIALAESSGDSAKEHAHFLRSLSFLACTCNRRSVSQRIAVTIPGALAALGLARGAERLSCTRPEAVQLGSRDVWCSQVIEQGAGELARPLPMQEVSGTREAPKGTIFEAGGQLFTLPDGMMRSFSPQTARWPVGHVHRWPGRENAGIARASG